MNIFIQILGIKRLRGYNSHEFFSKFLELKGYEVTKVTRVTGVTMAIKGCSPHQIQGYAVTGLPACGNFFFNFLELKGYEVTKVTKVTGVTMVIKFKITKLQGYQRVELFSSLF